jgi:hypothetical protein
MQGIIVFAVFMVLWKLLDIGIQAYQLYLQAVLEAFKMKMDSESDKGGKEEETGDNEPRTIGFQSTYREEED